MCGSWLNCPSSVYERLDLLETKEGGVETGDRSVMAVPGPTQLFIPQSWELKPLEDGDSPLRDHDDCTDLLTLTILLVSERAQSLLMISA